MGGNRCGHHCRNIGHLVADKGIIMKDELYGLKKDRDTWRWLCIVLFVCLIAAILLILLGCEGGGGGEAEATEALAQTRTVCTVDAELRPHVERAVDAWNDHDTSPLSATCTEHVRCLPKVIAHELGHALQVAATGRWWHTATGIMHKEGHRSHVLGITEDDLDGLPDGVPYLMMSDGAPCDHVVGWGYPSEPVLATEVAWYERETGRVWIDPSVPWRS